MPHLLVDISFHGFGHLSQTAPVVNELARRSPDLRVTVRSAAPRALLAQRLECPFDYLSQAFDFGMVMESAVGVRVEESAAAYRELHRGWARKVAAEAEQIKALAPDLLFANVPYLTLAAAHQAMVRSVAMCSLNWADIYRHYCGGRPETAQIHGEMLESYNRAACFLQPQPGMPMPDIAAARAIGPIARLGGNHRAEIDARLGLKPGDRLALIAMGGIHFRLEMENWPSYPGVRWVVPAAWQVHRADTVALESLGLHYAEVLASCDLLITKPGYGSFAEAGCHGIPVLYLERKDWPEEPYLVDWLKQHGRCLEVPPQALERGEIVERWEELFALPGQTPAEPVGAAQAADYLESMLA